MYDILKAHMFWKIWRRDTPTFISGGGSRMALIWLCSTYCSTSRT